MVHINDWHKGDETAGFESPGHDYIEGVVDLSAVLDLHRPARYPVRMQGQALLRRAAFATGTSSSPMRGLTT